MSDRWTERLSEYLDGDLGDRDRVALETHLASCANCREELEGLRAVVDRAHGLEHTAPASDLWPAIAARIEAGTRPVTMRRPAPWKTWRLSLSLPQASLAALALVMISAGAMWWTVGRAPRLVTRGPSETGSRPFATGTGPAAPSPASTTASAVPPDDAALTAAFADPRYDATIAELQSILDNERSRLDPITVKVVEKNLKIIDRAVAEARRAVAADPSSLYLREHLARVMMQKMSLLRQATQIAGAQG